jgi:hypothetical protein
VEISRDTLERKEVHPHLNPLPSRESRLLALRLAMIKRSRLAMTRRSGPTTRERGLEIGRAGLDNVNNRRMMYRNSLGLGYYKLLRILSDSYQVLDDRDCN